MSVLSKNWYDYMRLEIIEGICRYRPLLTKGQIAYVKLITSIIMQAVKDMESKNEADKQSAKDYLNGPLFARHCAKLGITQEGILALISYSAVERTFNIKSEDGYESDNE